MTSSTLPSPAVPARLVYIRETVRLLGQRCVAYHPRLVQLTGRVTAGLMLSQSLYWTKKLHLAGRLDGWFWKSAQQWQDETGLSRREQDTARATLKALGVWQEKRQGMPARLWYRIDLAALGRLLAPDGTFNNWDWRNEREVLRLLGRSMLFYRGLLTLTGSATSAVLLSRLFGEERAQLRSADDLGALWRRHAFGSIRAQTGLTRHELESARARLRQRNILHEKRAAYRVGGGAIKASVEWRLDYAVLIERLRKTGSENSQETIREVRKAQNVPPSNLAFDFTPEGAQLSSLAESGKPIIRKAANRISEKRQTEFPESAKQDFHNPPNKTGALPNASLAESGNSLYTGLTTFTPTTPKEDGNAHGTRVSGVPAEASGSGCQKLVWPNLIRADEKVSALRMLEDAGHHAQDLLDELAGQHALKPVLQPLNYLAALVRKFKRGEFVPAAAIRERERRERRQAELEQRRQAEATAHAQETSEEKERRLELGRARLEQIRRMMFGGSHVPQ